MRYGTVRKVLINSEWFFITTVKYRTTPCHTVPHRATPYHTVPHRTQTYRKSPHSIVPYRTVPYGTELYSLRHVPYSAGTTRTAWTQTINVPITVQLRGLYVRYCTTPYRPYPLSNVPYSTVPLWYSTVPYGTLRTVRYLAYGTVRYGTVQYGTVPYCTIRPRCCLAARRCPLPARPDAAWQAGKARVRRSGRGFKPLFGGRDTGRPFKPLLTSLWGLGGYE